MTDRRRDAGDQRRRAGGRASWPRTGRDAVPTSEPNGLRSRDADRSLRPRRGCRDRARRHRAKGQEDDLRLLVEEQAALNRVAMTVATESGPRAGLRRRDRGGGSPARRGRSRISFASRHPGSGHRRQVERAWRSDPGFRHGRHPGRQRALEGRSRGRARPDGHGRPRRRARRFASGSPSSGSPPSSPRRSSCRGDIWGAVVVSVTRDKQFAADAEERIASSQVSLAVASRILQAREEIGTLAEDESPQPCCRRRGDRGAARAPLQRRLRGARPVVRRARGLQSFAISTILTRWSSSAAGSETTASTSRSAPARRFKGGAIERVRSTGRTARIDLKNEAPDVRSMAAADLSSGVAAPIVVSGRLWGATSISTSGAGAVPRRTPRSASRSSPAWSPWRSRMEGARAADRVTRADRPGRRRRAARLERNLHDGARQRLVTLALGLRLAQSRLPDDPAGRRELLVRASDEPSSACRSSVSSPAESIRRSSATAG